MLRVKKYEPKKLMAPRARNAAQLMMVALLTQQARHILRHVTYA